MKKTLLLLVCISVFTNCKNDSKNNNENEIENKKETTDIQEKEITHLRGEFVYYADAAVLQTQREIYAVVINEKMHELDKMAKQYKVENTDYVTVEVKGKLFPKPQNEEGWPFRLDITEIISVIKSNPEDNNIVKLGTKE